MNQNSNRATILVVDDKPANIKVVKGMLSKDYIVLTAVNGEMALEIIEKEKPDLILLDIMMPGMDGYEVCRILKADEMTREIPIIFLTAITDTKNEAKGLDLGAVDYITKPIVLPVLKARVKTHLELMSARLSLVRQNEILHQERELVENIVLRMRKDTRFYSKKMNYLISPLEKTNGDILLSSRTPTDDQYILIGDFTGHGLPAAIGGPLVSSLFYIMSQNGFPLSTIANEINRELCAKLPVNIFMAAILIERNMATDELKIWNCSMQDALHIRNAQVVERIPSMGLALGITEQFYLGNDPKQLGLAQGDHVVAYSDGIVESVSEHGEMFGVARFEDELTQTIQNEIPLESIIDTLVEFTGINGITDDVTLVELQA